ncbi:hypothetical protein BG015_001503 [Linnemannia schmuckeri]|uniref:Galactose oxidase n=1 Tax=Linnemannia schmuckeri TaxID=64567 RepID=A0A9P5RPR2_9FUNG|nr:hypothetical protein BG015_001503 [Linnemannia schmuckeri]
MILFGGHEMDAISKNTTYILDVPSLEWIKGPAVEVAQSRSAMACSVSGDNVVIWGGIRRTGTDPANYTALDATPLILNLYFKQWVPKFERGTHYTPLPVAPPSPISPPTPENTSAPEKSNVGDIVGSTLGGLLLSALVVASYIAHKKPQFLRQLIGWGNEPAEQPHLPGFFPPVLDLQGPINPSPANNNGNSSNSTNNDQHNPPVSPPQNLPENSGTSTSPSHLSTTSSPEVDAIVTWIQSESRQHLEAAIPTKTEFTFEPPSGSVPRSEPSAPVLTAASPSTESSSSKEECELQVFYPKAPSRASTLSCTTTLHTPDSPFTSTSTSRSPITSVNSLAPSQGSSSSSQASHQDSLLASTHPSLSSSNVTRPNNRNNSLSSEARPVRQANTWHSTPADSVLSSDESTPYVSQVPLPIGVLPPLSSMQSDPLPVKAELISFSSTSQPPKEPERSKSSSSSSSFAPPVPVKPGHLAFLYMNGMREASRQQNNGNVLSKSTLENSNQNTNLRSDSKNAFRATINKSTARQVLPAAASTNTASTIDHNYPPRGGETPTSTSIHRHRKGRDATASETYTATTIAHHPRENAVVAAAPRFGATLIVTPTRNTLTAIRRQPQGGHEPARSSSRNPQNVRGVGARKATFGDETPKLGVQSLSDKESGTSG